MVVVGDESKWPKTRLVAVSENAVRSIQTCRRLEPVPLHARRPPASTFPLSFFVLALVLVSNFFFHG